MKIGLLTYHWVANYGANLQTLSTYCYLENNGYTPIIINWVPDDAMASYKESASEEQIKTHREFIARRCKLTREFSKQSEIEVILKENSFQKIFF